MAARYKQLIQKQRLVTMQSSNAWFSSTLLLFPDDGEEFNGKQWDYKFSDSCNPKIHEPHCFLLSLFHLSLEYCNFNLSLILFIISNPFKVVVWSYSLKYI